MGGASLDLVCYSLGVPVLLECFFGLWRPSCPAGLKLVLIVDCRDIKIAAKRRFSLYPKSVLKHCTLGFFFELNDLYSAAKSKVT